MILAEAASALTYQLSTSSAVFESSSLVINTALGKLHPPLMVSGFTGGGSKAIDVGNGRHGAFDISTYASFSQGGDLSGQIIRLNTATFTELHLTTFSLQSGWTLRPIGDGPLIIRVQGNVIVQGIIDCSGNGGQSANTLVSPLPTGGTGRCGGGSGGNGAGSASAAVQGTNGEAPTGTVTGGSPGTGSSGAGGGGGGGFNPQAPEFAQAGAGVGGGGAGTQYSDTIFSIIGAGTGGGGAAINSLNGAGGGGGGGRIYIFSAGDINISGSISAAGGAGGASTGNSGGGGGGSGGSIFLVAAGTLAGSGSVLATGGAGGTSVGGSSGGKGSGGRIWGTDRIGGSSGIATVTPNYSGLVNEGLSGFQTGNFNASSISLDFDNYHTRFSSPLLSLNNSGSGAVSVALSGSQKGFAAESSGYLSFADIATLNGSRYLKVNINLVNNSSSAPIELSGLQFQYELGEQRDFEYLTSGCGRIDQNGILPTGLILILFLPILLWCYLRARLLNFWRRVQT